MIIGYPFGLNMRQLFPVYHKPTDNEFSKMWQEGIFTFDANVLLNIYRYSPETRERFFEVLQRLKERIWVPHQAAHEYHKHRLDEISNQFRTFEDIEKHLNTSLKELEDNHRKHPFGIDVSPLTKIIKNTIKRAKPILQEINLQCCSLLASDPFRETLAELFAGKLGEPYSKDNLEKDIHQKAEERFKQDIPPGYKDKTKGGTDKYGDVILWFQLLDYAKSQKKPIILTTDDGKEDWWLQHKGKTIGPRPELIQEMSSKAGVSFHMYSSDQFLIYAQNFLDLQDKQAAAAVEEVREIRQQQRALEVPQINLDAMQKALEASRINWDAIFPRVNLDAMQQVLEASRINWDAIQIHLAPIQQILKAVSPISDNLLVKPVLESDLPAGLGELDQSEQKNELSGDEADHLSDKKTDNNGESEDGNLSDA